MDSTSIFGNFFVLKILHRLQLGTSNGNVPLFDYLVSPKSLDPSKIPLFFIYKVETAMGGIQNLLLQYKVNEKLNQTYLDVDIIVNFKENISNYGIKTIPTANKITDRQVSWKVKIFLKGDFPI